MTCGRLKILQGLYKALALLYTDSLTLFFKRLETFSKAREAYLSST